MLPVVIKTNEPVLLYSSELIGWPSTGSIERNGFRLEVMPAKSHNLTE